MSEIDKIKPDTFATMTNILRRAFLSEGCNPHCHGCFEPIKVGQQFQLAKLKRISMFGDALSDPEYNDEMLCINCDPRTVTRDRKKDGKENLKVRQASRHYGYSRPSQLPDTHEGEK